MSHRLNAVELAEHRILMALFMDMEKEPDQFLDRERLAKDYGVELTERMFSSIIRDMDDRGWVEPYGAMRDGEFVMAASLRTEKHAKALARILDTLEAKTFDIDWKRRKISTDAPSAELTGTIRSSPLIPVPEGDWMVVWIGGATLKRAAKQVADAASTPAATAVNMGNHTAGRDVYVNYGPSTQNHNAPAGEGRLGRWAAFATILGFPVAVLALYYTDNFPWKIASKPATVEASSVKQSAGK